MGRPVMSENWIIKCWERRRILFSSAVSDEMVCGKIFFETSFVREQFFSVILSDDIQITTVFQFKISISRFCRRRNDTYARTS